MQNIAVTEGVGCTLSSDKNGYSLQRLVAKVGISCKISQNGYKIYFEFGEVLFM